MRVIIVALLLGLILGVCSASLWLLGDATSGARAALLPVASSLTQAPSVLSTMVVPKRVSDVVALRSIVEQHATLYTMVRHADEEGLRDLLEQASALGEVESGWIFEVIYSRYAEIDGHAALAHLRRSGMHVNDQRALTGLLVAWMRFDEASAIEALRALGGRERVQVAMLALQGGLPLSDAQRRSIAGAAGLGPQLQQLDLAARRVRLGDDPEAQFDELLAGDDYAHRQVSLMALVGQWARRDPEAAMAAAERVSPMNLRTQLRHQVLSEWAQADAAAALERALSVPQPRERDQLAAMVLQQAAVDEPRVALALVARLAPDQQGSASIAVLGIWGQTDPMGASVWLESVTDPSLRDAVIGQIAQGLARHDPTRAHDWVAALPAREQSRAAEGLVAGLAETDPDAASLALELIGDASRRANAVHGLAVAWARHDPRRAAAWIEQNVAADQRPALLARTVEQWAQYDVEAALAYADALESLPERESAIVAVLPSLSFDLELADVYFQSLTQPEWRQRAARMLYAFWQRVDPARAEPYRVTAGIEEEGNDPLLRSRGAVMGVMGTRQALRELRNPAFVGSPR